MGSPTTLPSTSFACWPRGTGGSRPRSCPRPGRVLHGALEPVADPGDREAVGWIHDLNRGHLVHRERAGLVGVDRGREPERLDRWEILHDGVPPGQLDAANRQDDLAVGSASGIAAIASETALTNSTSHGSPRCRPNANITIIVRPAAEAIHSVGVQLLRERRLLPSRGGQHAGDPAHLGSSPVAVTISSPLPCVTGEFMNAMLVCSPGGRSPSARVSALLSAGTLSPVRPDSSICRRARRHDPSVRRHLVAGRDQHEVADHDLLRRDLGLDPAAAHARSSSAST